MLYSALITITNTTQGFSTYLETLACNRERSRIMVSEDPEVVRITVEAADAPAFRAAINSVTQTVSVFDTILQTASNQTSPTS